MKGQSISGEEGFDEEMVGYVKGTRDITEILRMQRHAGLPELKELLKGIENKAGDTSARCISKATLRAKKMGELTA